MAGFPDAARSADILRAVVAGGAEVLEIGVPFSDPVADGPLLRQASYRALQGGMTCARTLDLLGEVRVQLPETPFVLMGYANPFLAFGLEALAAKLAGLVDAVVVPDLSVDAAPAWAAVLAHHGVSLAGFAAETTSDQRLRDVAARATGFLYAIAARGVTGARPILSPAILPLLARARAVTSLPLVAGFGLSRPEHVEALAEHAEGLVTASAVMAAVAEARTGEEARSAERFVRSMLGGG